MPRKKKTLSGRSLLVVVADESGSMYSQADDVRNGFNEYIEEVRRNTEDVLVTLVKFNSLVSAEFRNVPIAEVERLDEGSYSPGGSTALYDGVATGIKIAENEVDESDKVIFVIFTDGQENASIENTREQVFKKITAKQKDGNWTIVFLGADQDAWVVSSSLGVAAGNTMAYAGSNHAGMMRGVASATVTATASPTPSSLTFFNDAGQSAEDYNKTDVVEPENSS